MMEIKELTVEERERAYSSAMAIFDEYIKAKEKFPKFNSLHEAYAVILEEQEELWKEIKLKPKLRDFGKIEAEALQLGAMVLGLLTEFC